MLVFLLSAPVAAYASDAADKGEPYPYYAYENDETGYYAVIYDEADLLSSSEEALIASKMAPITAYGNVGFFSVSVNYTSADQYAAELLASYLGRESSVLFLIDMDNRKIHIEANDGSGIGKRITTSYANVITDNVYTYASDGDYYGCADSVYDQIFTLLDGGRIAQPMKYVCYGLFAVALGMLTCYGIARGTSKARRTTDEEMLMYAAKKVDYTQPQLTFHYTEKKYHPRSSGGGGGHGGGGGGSHGGGHSF